MVLRPSLEIAIDGRERWNRSGSPNGKLRPNTALIPTHSIHGTYR
jgi:hypothetical protein